jgi:hypothetical protein
LRLSFMIPSSLTKFTIFASKCVLSFIGYIVPQIIKNCSSMLSIILFLISYFPLEAKILVFVQVFNSMKNSIAVILNFFY